MMIVSPTPVFRWTDNNGNPAVGWMVETYIAGSSTLVDTYTDATGTAENTNPIILDARGEANIWLDPAISYKYVIKNNLGVVQDTIDQIQAGSGGSGGLTRVYYNDSSTIAYSGLGTLATPLSSSVKLSAYPNNALQIRPDGLYAMAIGGGGSVAWGSITGVIGDQSDLIAKFGEYLPLTFTSPQVVTYTTEGQYVFANAGEFVAQNLAVGSAQNNFVSLKPFDLSVRFVDGANAYDSKLTLATLTAGRTWTLPDASGTIALTSSLGDYIKRDGTTTTTASIPFALGATFSDNQALAWSVGSTIRGTGAGNILVRPWLASNGGFDVLSYVNTFDTTTHHILKWNSTTTPPTGTQAYLLGIDANGRIIQGSAGSGFVTISGHNDLTTPWSIGDASTWGTSSAGIQIDPVGSYGLYLKGNSIIEQAVSQALTLYRPVASGDICLNFDAWDLLGTQSNYAQVCGVVVSNTANSVGGGLDLEIAIAGVLTPLVQVRQAGSTLVGAWSVTGQLTATGSSGILTNYLHQNNSVNDASLQEIQIFTRGNASGAYYGWNTRGNGAGGTTDLVLRWGGSNVLGFVGNVATFSGFLNGTQRARFGTGADDTVNALQVGGTSNFTGKASFPASVAGSASINIVTGVAVTSPVTGDIWSPSADTMNWRSGANTRTFALREVNQSFSGTQTFSVISATSTITATNTITGRQLAQTRQTSATTTGAITWALGSGGTMDLTAALTGAVTMNITAPSAGAWSALFVTQGATPQTITLSLTGVSWISTGVNGTTGTNTITIPASDFIADKSSCIQIYWSTATRAYVTVT